MENGGEMTIVNGEVQPVQSEITCQSCAWRFVGDLRCEDLECPRCYRPFRKLERVGLLLEKWYYPRRWLAAISRPRVPFLLEQLWSSNGQGERLFRAIAPPNTNYDIFLNKVTRTVARGIEEGWADLVIPEDPLSENPIYKLVFNDPDQFGAAVAAQFPDVNWDESVEVEDVERPRES